MTPTNPPRPAHLNLLPQLWREYLGENRWVPVDRWLSHRLRQLKGPNQTQRLEIARAILDACRFSICVLFCESLFNASEKLDKCPDIAAFTDRFASEHLDWRAIKNELQAMDPEDFFFWLSRRQSVIQAIPAIDSMSTFRHRSSKGRQVWSWLTGAIPQSTSPFDLIWQGLPPVLQPYLRRRGETSRWSTAEAQRFILSHHRPSPLYIRSNRVEHNVELISNLTRLGFSIFHNEPPCLGISGPKGLFELPDYRQGRFEVQDLASQMIGRAVDVTPGCFVWDACAGRGGKSLQLAADLAGRGAVYASDIDERKLHTLRLRARHADLGHSLRTLSWNGQDLPEFGKEIGKRHGFDRVLVDAPCSGSGTWRRNPDGRLDFDPARLNTLTTLQLELLSRAAAAVRPSGRLIYATCSFFCEENEDIVTAFLSHHPEFTLASQSLFGNPGFDSDTTFAAVLIRQG